MEVTEVTKKILTLTLTREEQKVIQDMYKILDKDNFLDAYGVWDILTDIYIGDVSDNSVSTNHGYKIKIIDQVGGRKPQPVFIFTHLIVYN